MKEPFLTKLKVSVKWKTSVLDSFECTKEDQVLDLKKQIYSVTDVECQNQKLFFKGKLLKVSSN